MNTATNSALAEILVEALAPCVHFESGCRSCMRWDPTAGHIPRGCFGATGDLDEVELVLVMAEPGNPHDEESYDPAASPEEHLTAFTDHAYRCFRDGRDQFHANVRHILDLCFPDLEFAQQMRRVWITESVLCSAPVECGNVPVRVARTCVDAYLRRQLALFPDAVVAALGAKARNRLKNVDFVAAAHPSPPGCNHRGARESWQAIADAVNAAGT